MKKQEQIRKRTWEYFWQQKKDEVAYVIKWTSIIIGSAVGILSLTYLLGHLSKYLFGCFFFNSLEGCNTIDIAEYMGAGFLFLFFAFMIVVIILAILSWPIEWIMGNWKKAKRRAKEDFK